MPTNKNGGHSSNYSYNDKYISSDLDTKDELRETNAGSYSDKEPDYRPKKTNASFSKVYIVGSVLNIY